MKVYDAKTKTTKVVFNNYNIGDTNTCPECKRAFKEQDIQRLESNKIISCPKCGARLSRTEIK